MASFQLLTLNNPKILKGEKYGFLSVGLHLAPHRLSGHNVCPMASKGCSTGCLNTSGHGRYSRTQNARIRKTRFFFENREGFGNALIADIRAAQRKAAREHKGCVVRLNLTSDIQYENIQFGGKTIFEHFPDVQFMDYTKIPTRFFKPLPANYHLTFSRSESNAAQAEMLSALGHNVAVVFDTPKGCKLPSKYLGRKVIDGTKHDLRFLDKKGVFVGLRALGRAMNDKTGFVVKVYNIALDSNPQKH
jgi:uncharacterized protein (DUF3820 family)